MTPPCLQVALVEDSAPEREAITCLLRGTPGFACAGAFANAEEALAKLPDLKPDIVLMDIGLPGMSGIACIRNLRQILPATRVLMFTVFEDHDRIFEALKAGATGYLLKKTPPAKVLEAIQELHAGGAPMSGPIARQVVTAFQEPTASQSVTALLTHREDQILRLLAKGFLYKEIAAQLGISVATVRTHIVNIYSKLEVRSRHEATQKLTHPNRGG